MQTLTTGTYYGTNNKERRLDGLIMSTTHYPAGHKSPWHFHENPYFAFVQSGHFEEKGRKKSFLCERGTFMFHNMEEPHCNHVHSAGGSFHLEIENQWLKKHDLHINSLEGLIHIKNPSQLAIINSIVQENSINDDFSPLAVEGSLMNLFSCLFRNRRTSHNAPGWLVKVKELLHDTENVNLNLTDLANEIGVHPVTLSKQFSLYNNSTLGQYHRNVKLNRALDLIQTTQIPIAQLAIECGFSDQSHLNKWFKIRFGYSPLQSRKKFGRD